MTNYQELLRAFETAKRVRDAAQGDFKRAEKALMDFRSSLTVEQAWRDRKVARSTWRAD
jgi:hypothetical protein